MGWTRPGRGNGGEGEGTKLTSYGRHGSGLWAIGVTAGSSGHIGGRHRSNDTEINEQPQKAGETDVNVKLSAGEGQRLSQLAHCTDAASCDTGVTWQVNYILLDTYCILISKFGLEKIQLLFRYEV